MYLCGYACVNNGRHLITGNNGNKCAVCGYDPYEEAVNDAYERVIEKASDRIVNEIMEELANKNP